MCRTRLIDDDGKSRTLSEEFFDDDDEEDDQMQRFQIVNGLIRFIQGNSPGSPLRTVSSGSLELQEMDSTGHSSSTDTWISGMRVQTEEWQRFIPGIRMYEGKKTLFYNGEILYHVDNDEPLIYNWEERESWEVIIVLPGVEEIPEDCLRECEQIDTVIMSDSVIRIEGWAF
ncbi:predicted protein [Chaetoceros tenuissimus]|uniref:Uncharacterized protein n=1 Tax=Chaetoceros tenuissimus TaxID=426638 RepID=A0AAD3H4F0_9STRA|nr:predicted protein [Chaetoceros tenuissimus]